MRMPINRGFPILAPRKGALELFRPPQYTDMVFRLSATAWATTPQATTIQRVVATSYDPRTGTFEDGGAFPDVPIGANDSQRYVIYREYLMRGTKRAIYLKRAETSPAVATVSPYAVFAYAEMGLDLGHFPDRLLSSERPTPPYTTQFLRPMFEQTGESRVHTLTTDQVDIITLKCVLPASLAIELRFYDGTYRNGVPNSINVPYKNYNAPAFGGDMMPDIPGAIEQRVLLDRHPMRGPGYINVLVTEPAYWRDTYPPPEQVAYLYGGAGFQ